MDYIRIIVSVGTSCLQLFVFFLDSVFSFLQGFIGVLIDMFIVLCKSIGIIPAILSCVGYATLLILWVEYRTPQPVKSISQPNNLASSTSQNQSSHLQTNSAPSIPQTQSPQPNNLASSTSQNQSSHLQTNSAPSIPQTQSPQPNNVASSTSQTQSSRLPIKFVYVWEFLEQDDCWLPFVEDQQVELENAYRRKDSELRFPPKDGQKRHRWGRVISFADMTQRNEGTGKVRNVRRRRELKIIDEEEIEKQLRMQNVQTAPCNSRVKQFPPGALFPLNTLAHTASPERREFSKSEPDFDTLVRIFQESMTSHRKSYGSDVWCPKPMVEVTKIEEVVNPFKQRFYEAAQDEVASRNPLGCGPVPGISAPKYHPPMGHVDLNEYFLFHGTKYDQVDQIIEHGLDPQRGHTTGAMFGHGTYFAENASKSDLYTTCDQCTGKPSADGKCHHPTGIRCMIVAQVLLGKSCPVNKVDPSKRMRARDREDGKGPYDSHTALKRADGGCVDHMEFIIFKEQRALVRFVIFYKHRERCECKDCLFRRT